MQTFPTTGSMSVAPPSSSSHIYYRVIAGGILLLPLATLLVLELYPALNVSLENHWFHFQIVTFVSLVAFVLGISTIFLLNHVSDTRAFFVPIGLVALAAIFMLHGLATPGVLELQHAEHNLTVPLFARPDLTVGWSAPLSLLAGAVFFAIASWNWSARAIRWFMAQRRALLLLFTLLYLVYVFIAFAFPLPLEWFAQLAPFSRFILVTLAGILYIGAAWNFWQTYHRHAQRLDAALAFASLLLGEALLPLILLPVWSAGWWSYHVLMLLAFCVALGAVVIEYERARHFQLTTYFTAVSVIVTALLALAAGEIFTRLFSDMVPANALNNVRWGGTLIFIVLAALMFATLLLVVRRGDMLLRTNSLRLQQQQVELERGRLVESLVPIGVAMGESLNLERVLELICRESHKLFQVDNSLIWYRQGDELIARSAFGSDSAGFLGMRQPLRNNTLLGARVVREQRPIYVNNAMDSSGVSKELVLRFGIQSILGVPLFSENQVVGALVMIDLRHAERFGALDLDVAQLFGQQAAQALTHARLYEKIQHQTLALTNALTELRANYNQTLAALSAALDARDHETEGHSHRVTAYALLLANALNILDPQTREALEWGSLLHDVGKIGVPDAILHKPAALSDTEWTVMRQHPEIGYQIVRSIPFLRPAFAVVRHHHERWDGSGYPMNLRGQDIPLPARIFALADTLDAMTTDRPYRRALPFSAAYQEIAQRRGTQFDPQVVDAFRTITELQWRAAANT